MKLLNCLYATLGGAWCSTKVDNSGRHIGGQGNYGFCDPKCQPSTLELVDNRILQGLGANDTKVRQKGEESTYEIVLGGIYF